MPSRPARARAARAAAAAAVDGLSKATITELKSLPKPPAGVDVVTACCLILVEKEFKNHKWDRAKKMLANVDAFVARARALRAEDVDDEQARRVAALVAHPGFSVEAVSSKSLAAARLCEWVIALAELGRLCAAAKAAARAATDAGDDARLRACRDLLVQIRDGGEPLEEMEAARAAAAAANEIAASCEADLALAMPALEGAMAALRSLSKGDLVEIKAMKKPPAATKMVMEAVCIMLGVEPEKIQDPHDGTKKVDDYWGPAQKVVLADSNLLTKLVNYDKDNMAPAMIEKIATEYTSNELFGPDLVKKGSVAAAGLCKWVHAMVVYDKVAKTVGPKKAALKKAQETLATALKFLLAQRRLRGGVGLKEALEDVGDLAIAAVPAVEAATAALDAVNVKHLRECKTMSKPPPGVDDVFGAVMVLFAGVKGSGIGGAIAVQKNGKVLDKDRGWDAAKKALLGNPRSCLEELKAFKETFDAGMVPEINWREVRPFLRLEHFTPEIIAGKNSAAAGLCDWVINIVMYHDVVPTVEPKEQPVAGAAAPPPPPPKRRSS